MNTVMWSKVWLPQSSNSWPLGSQTRVPVVTWNYAACLCSLSWHTSEGSVFLQITPNRSWLSIGTAVPLHTMELQGGEEEIFYSFMTLALDRDFSWSSSVPPGECRDSALKSGRYRFLPNPFQFVIHVSPFHSTQYSLSYWKSVVK
jgi:hypothetical protein